MVPFPAALKSSFNRLKVRRIMLALVRGVGIAASIFLFGAILAGWADLIIPLSSRVRLFIEYTLFASGGLFLLVLLIRASRSSTARNLAQALDRAGLTGGQIQAGVELALLASDPAQPLTVDLTRRAVELSAELAKAQQPAKANPLAPALRSYWVVLGVLCFLCGAWLFWPSVVTAQLNRVLDPTGEHTRHCPYTFHVQPSAKQIVFGEPLEVLVRVDGAGENEPFEWVIEQAGRKPWRFPLIRRADGSMFGNLNSVLSDVHFHIIGMYGESAPFHVHVINTPQIRETAVRIVYPPYTGLPPFEGALPEGGPIGVRGTQVTLQIASNRPLSGGSIEIRTDAAAESTKVHIQKIVMKPKSATENEVVSGIFEISADLQFSATIVDVDGLESKEPLRGRCLLAPDQAPRVAISEPRQRSYATADIALDVRIEAEDDFGIGEITLYRNLNGSRDYRLPIPVPVTQRRSPKIEISLPLLEWSLDAGDVIELYVVARDNDPGGAKSAQTPTHRVTIITKEQYLDMLRQQETLDDLYERYKPWLRRLVELRRKWEQAKENKDPKAIAEMREALREAAEELEIQLKEPPVFEADLEFSKELKELQETLRQAMQDIDDGNFDEVDNRLSSTQKELDTKLDLPLEALIKLSRLIEDESLFTLLAQVQEDIARRAERFNKQETLVEPTDISDLKALLEEERELPTVLQRLLQDIRDHAGQLPQDNEEFKDLITTANEFATKVHDAEIEQILDQAISAMSAGRGTDSHALAKKAAELMMSFVAQNQNGGMGGKAMKELRKFGPHLANSVAQSLNARGMGGGGGGGRGFSMGGRNNSAGLYGSRPQRKQGGGQGGGRKSGGGSGVSGEGLKDVKGFGIHTQFDDGSASGVPLSALPSRYRSAVRDFNRHIVDDENAIKN